MGEFIRYMLIANIYIQPTHFAVGIIGNSINIAVLCSRALRSSSCTHYFLAYAIFSIIYISVVCPAQTLRSYNIDLSGSPIMCRINLYIIYLPPFLARIMLVLASFDRFCSSLLSVRFRTLCTKRKARTTIVVSTITSSVFMLPIVMIYYWDEATQRCSQYSNSLVNIYLIFQTSIYYILSPLTMATFGSLTISNIRQQAIRSRRQVVATHDRRNEKQLTRMLLLQIIAHLIFTIPFCIVYLMISFNPRTQTPMIVGLRYLFVVWLQFDYSISFFLYTFAGTLYRKQLITILKWFTCHHGTIHPMTTQQSTRMQIRSVMPIIPQTTDK